MRVLLKKSVSLLLLFSAVAIAVVVVGVCFLRRSSTGIADAENPTAEQMEQYFEQYAEVTAKNDPGNMLIVMSNGRPESYGAVDVVEAPDHTYYLMYDSEEKRDEAYAKLEQDDSISVEKNIKMKKADYNSWGASVMGLDYVREMIGYTGMEIRVAVIDTGLDTELFKENFPDISLQMFDVETDSSVSELVDYDGHGTHVAGTIAESMPKNATLYVVRATRGDSDEFYASDVTAALQHLRYAGVKVINMSLGSYEQVESQKFVIDDLKSSGVVTVAAAGNDSVSDVLYPAGYDSTLSVSAINSDYSLASYSNYGSTVDFAAPGTSIRSINGIYSGTSMATPHVTAAVAHLKSFNPSLSFNDVKTLLSQHVRDLGEPGKDQQFGYGVIDLNGAEFCGYTEYCDEYGVFVGEAPVYTKMEIDEVTLTPVNYYSISNLMLTEVKLYTDASNYVTKKLQDVNNVTIVGYGPETYGLQTVTITCEGVSQTVYVVNPDDYTPGWEYRLNDSDEVLLTRYYDVMDYDDDNYDTSLSRLYVPGQINGKNVVELSETERTYNCGIDEEYVCHAVDTAFERSSYANQVLKEVYLPDTLKVISDDTFFTFWKLEKVAMAADAVKVGNSAFYGTYRLRVVDGSIIEMGEYAFASAGRLKAIELAEGMTTISDSAFSGCASLAEIEIPSTVTSIGIGAFSGAKSLERVVFLGDKVTIIENGAFSGTKSLTNITLPEKLERIGYRAFYESALTSIYIPASVNSINSEPFANNGDLATITVDANNTTYYDVDGKALMTDYYARKDLIAGTKSMLIPEGTTNIGSRAFAGFTTEKELIIPESVNDIGSYAFLGCTGLTRVAIPRLLQFSHLEHTFEREVKGEYGSPIYVPLDVMLMVYHDDIAYDYAVENEFNYQTIDAAYARVVDPFNFGDTLSDDTEVEFYIGYGTYENGVYVNHTGTDGLGAILTVSGLMSVTYSGDVNQFRIGDTYFTAGYKDILNRDATIRVEVTVNGEYPEYTVPTGLTGKLRKNLSSVELPEGFSWMEDNYLWELGEHTFMAKYLAGDPAVYAPVENIPVTVNVVPGRTMLPDPVITVDSKTFDNRWEIDDSLVHVTIDGLTSDDFLILASASSSEVGLTSAYVTVYLNYNIAENYGFGEDYVDYYSYYVDSYEILPAEEVDIEIDNRADGIATVTTQADGVKVTSEKACTVIVTYDGGETYSKVSAVAVDGEENTYKFEFEVNDDVEVLVVLKGDGNMDGMVTSADLNKLTRSLVGDSLPAHRDLTALERLILDVNGDNKVSSADTNRITRSLIGSSLPAYQAIPW